MFDADGAESEAEEITFDVMPEDSMTDVEAEEDCEYEDPGYFGD